LRSKYLSWEDVSYNTSHHTAINTTPFKVVYGRIHRRLFLLYPVKFQTLSWNSHFGNATPCYRIWKFLCFVFTIPWNIQINTIAMSPLKWVRKVCLRLRQYLQHSLFRGSWSFISCRKQERMMRIRNLETRNEDFEQK